MPNTMTVKQIYEEVKSNLGGSAVAVELDDKDLDVCLASAVRLLNRNRPRRGRAALSVSTGQKKYRIDHPNLQGVLEVNFVTNRQGSGADPFDFEENGLRQVLQGNGQTFGDLQTQMGYVEDARRIAGSEPEWHGQWEGASYYLYIDVQRTPVDCSYLYTWHVEAKDDEVKGLKHLDDGDIDWLIKYVTARAKQILSRVRGKFGGIATTEGGVDQTDAESLLQEGKEEQQQLEEELLKRRRPLPPVIE